MNPPLIVIIDYGLGNLFNVSKAFAYQEISSVVSKKPEDMAKADAIVLPGVGAFGDGMRGLVEGGFVEPIHRFAASGKPILGICLGMQMLMEESYEMGHHKGLGLIEGSVLPFRQTGNEHVRVPHMGWNTVQRAENGDSSLLCVVRKQSMFYFVHSFYVRPKNTENGLAETEYEGMRFCSIVAKGNIFGCQFHPEKSGMEGLKFLHSFAYLNQGVKTYERAS